IMTPRLSRHYRDGPPRYSGQRPHAFADRPTTLTPSINPRLGASGQHKELHRYALWRIFRPAFRSGGLTRILHHASNKKIITYFNKNCHQRNKKVKNV